MPTFALHREYDPSMTRAQIDGVALAGAAALQTFLYRGGERPVAEPHGISWVRSYWQPGGTWGMCLFEAPSLQVLSAFQELCGTPFLDAMEVEELSPPDANGDPQVAVAVSVDPEPSESPDVTMRNALGLAAFDCVHSYWASARNSGVALLSTTPSQRIPGATILAESVVHLQPSDYQ